MRRREPGDDREDFDAFVRARSLALMRTAYVLTGSRADAEDLLQEALTGLARHWSRVDPERREGYARTALHRAAIDRWRRRSVRPEVVGEITTDPAAPDDAHERRTDAVVLRDALATLTPKQRAVLVLRYYEQHTEVETADVLGISVGTVKSQTRRALERLRELNPELVETYRPHLRAVEGSAR